MIFIITFIDLNAVDVVSGSRIFIKTERLTDCRRIWVQFADTIQIANIPKPEIICNKSNGLFKIVLPGIDSERYFGMKKIDGKGVFPFHLNINANNSTALTINCKTLPNFEMDSYYSFDRNSYIFDVSWYKDDEIVPLFSGSEGKILTNNRITNTNEGDEQLLKTQYRYIIQRSVYIGAILFIILISFVLIGRIRSQSSAVNESANRQNIDPEINVRIQEAKSPPGDGAIRDLASKRNISYDEAALIIQTEIEVL